MFARKLNKSGSPVYKFCYSKYRKGHYVVKNLKNQTFEYLDNIWLDTVSECEASSSSRKLSLKEKSISKFVLKFYKTKDTFGS